MACTVCDLPTPEPPVTAAGVEGKFCCRGCLEIARRLDTPPDDAQPGPQADGAVTAQADALDTGDESADGTDVFLSVEGMHCSTCERYLEALATDHEAVRDAQASYPAGTVRLVCDPEAEDFDADALAGHLGGAGYDVRPVDHDGGDEDRPVARLLVGGFFGMMAMLWYVLFLYPAYLGLPADLLLFDVHGSAGRYLLANLWVMASVVLFYTGWPILRGAYVSLRARQPNMDLLVALAAGTAYVYSTVAGLLGHVEVYFDIAIVVVLVVTLGDYYKRRITDRAADALSDLTRERVGEARRRAGDGTETVTVDALSAGDEVVVKPGERVPLDGEVVEGEGSVDASLVTGEAIPERRTPGDEVVGGALVSDGGLVVEVEADERSTLDRVVRRLWAIQSATPGAQRLADRIALVFVPLVVLLAAGAAAVHVLAGAGPTAALLTGLTVLIVSCPCALGLATPLSVAAATREALDRGIAVLDESVFERATDVDVVAFDKTGTLTTGEMAVTAVETGGASEAAVLERAAALEQFADHPVADAVVRAADGADATVADVERHPGRGVSGQVGGEAVVVGRRELLADHGLTVPDGLAAAAETAREQGEVPALVGWDGAARGVLVAGDVPRPGWQDVVETLAADHEVVVVTGDGESAAARFRAHDGVSELFAEVPPEGKAALVVRLRERGTVAMVGDGTNDAPALAQADVSIAMGSGTALAADAADAVVTGSDLARVPEVFSLTRAARGRMRQNLAWAFGYNAIAVPLAALGALNPLLAAAAMSASSLLVVGNSARTLPGG